MNNPFRGLPREVGVMVVVAFFVALGYGIVAPAIPLFARSFHVSNFQASLVVSMFVAFRLLFAPIAGRLVNLVGERIVLTTGIGIVAVSSLLAGLSGSFNELLVLRGIGGAGSAMFSVSALSLLLRVSSSEQRGRASAAFQGGFLLGGITGPVFGSVLLAWSLRAPFFFYAATLFAAGTVAVVYLSSARLTEKAEDLVAPATGVDAPRHITKFTEAWSHRPYKTALVNNFAVGWSVLGVRSTLLPLFLVGALHQNRVLVGVGIFVAAICEGIALAPAGSYSDRKGRKPPLTLGSSLILLALLLLAAFPNIVVYFLASAMFGFGAACVGSSSAAVVGDTLGGRGGTSVAAYQMASDLGSVVGLPLAAYLSDAFSFSAAFLMAACVSAVALGMIVTMPETLRRRETIAPRPIIVPEEGQ